MKTIKLFLAEHKLPIATDNGYNIRDLGSGGNLLDKSTCCTSLLQTRDNQAAKTLFRPYSKIPESKKRNRRMLRSPDGNFLGIGYA